MQNNSTYRLFEDKVDKLMHDKLANQHIEVPSMEWESLQQRLIAHNAPKSKNYKNLALLLALLLLLTGGTFYFATKNNTKSTTVAANGNTNTNNQTNSNTPTVKETNTTADNHTSIVSNNGSTATIPNTIPENNRTQLLRNPVNIATTPSIDKVYTDAMGTVKKEKPEKVKKHKKQVFNRSTKEPIENSTQDESVLLTPEKGLGNSKTTIENTTIENNQAAEAVLETEEQKESNTVVKEADKIITTPTSIPNADKAIVTKMKAPKVKRERLMPEHDFGQERIWYVEAFSGVNNSIKHKNSFAAFLAPAGYTDKRLQQEGALSTVQAGINFKTRKNHFVLSGGISFLQLGDKINYDSANIGMLSQKINNKTSFTYLEIPLIAGYEIAHKRWGLSLQGGLSAGLLLNLAGQYASINNFNTQLFDVKDNKTTFKKSVFNVILNPQVNYYFSSKMNFFVSPIYRRNLQPITVADANLKQKYNSFGINIGIRTMLD
jgi:uncharacterized protein (UPF0333 family)